MEQGLESVIKKFTDLALNSKSLKEAKSAMDIAKSAVDIAERSFRLAAAQKKPKRVSISDLAEFLNRIRDPIKRSALFVAYEDYCESKGFEPDRKSDFFSQLVVYGFRTKKDSRGEYVSHPPLDRKKLIIDSTEI